MIRLQIGALALILAGCGYPVVQQDGPDPQPAPEIANEAGIAISDAELAALNERAEQGDLAAIRRLANAYAINAGSDDAETIYWELQAARNGDCDLWADLMFLVTEDGGEIPDSYFQSSESLESIGEANNCPRYEPIK
jgi:hypothetical protein